MDLFSFLADQQMGQRGEESHGLGTALWLRLGPMFQSLAGVQSQRSGTFYTFLMNQSLLKKLKETWG